MRGRARAASSTTVASGAVRTSSAGNIGSPGSDKTKRPSDRRYCGGLARTTVARTVSLLPSSRRRTNASVCPAARRSAPSRSVGVRAIADRSATPVSGEKSVAGSKSSTLSVRVFRPFSSAWASVRRTTTRPSE